jgi:hypothetical protein
MTVVIRRIMAERSKRVLIDIPRISNQRLDEIAGAYIVPEVAEEMAAEGIAKILNDTATVGVGAGLRKLIRSRLREEPAAGGSLSRAGLNLRSS